MKMKGSMLDYCKIVLTKMSFSEILFVKEYRKSMQWLSKAEAQAFREWVFSNFKPALLKQINR